MAFLRDVARASGRSTRRCRLFGRRGLPHGALRSQQPPWSHCELLLRPRGNRCLCSRSAGGGDPTAGYLTRKPATAANAATPPQRLGGHRAHRLPAGQKSMGGSALVAGCGAEPAPAATATWPPAAQEPPCVRRCFSAPSSCRCGEPSSPLQLDSPTIAAGLGLAAYRVWHWPPSTSAIVIVQGSVGWAEPGVTASNSVLAQPWQCPGYRRARQRSTSAGGGGAAACQPESTSEPARRARAHAGPSGASPHLLAARPRCSPCSSPTCVEQHCLPQAIDLAVGR